MSSLADSQHPAGRHHDSIRLVRNKSFTLDPDTCFLSIPVSPEQIKIPKEKLRLGSKDFLAKDEFHITVIGSNVGLLIKGELEKDPTKRDLFLRAIAETSWDYELRNKF